MPGIPAIRCATEKTDRRRESAAPGVADHSAPRRGGLAGWPQDSVLCQGRRSPYSLEEKLRAAVDNEPVHQVGGHAPADTGCGLQDFDRETLARKRMAGASPAMPAPTTITRLPGGDDMEEWTRLTQGRSGGGNAEAWPAEIFLCALRAFLRLYSPHAQEAGPGYDAPKKLTTYTIKLDDAQMDPARCAPASGGWMPCESGLYAFRLQGSDCNVAAYTSGKVVVAGQGHRGVRDDDASSLKSQEHPSSATTRCLHPDWFRAARGPRREWQGRFLRPGDCRHGDCRQRGDRHLDQGRRTRFQKDRRYADHEARQAHRGTMGATAKTCFSAACRNTTS